MKRLLLSPDCKLTDDELMRDNPTIANPTNKKIKVEELSEDEPILNSLNKPAST